MIDPKHPELSIQTQCALVSLAYSSYYYQPKPMSAETEHLMKLLDQMYTKHPGEGKIKRALKLGDVTGLCIGVQRVRTLMATMGLETLYPKPTIQAHQIRLMRYIPICYEI
ncbi:MAG: hypothetical protein AAGB12_16245 [Pseudomonadota bacterium]